MATKSFKGYVPATVHEFELESPDGATKLTVKCKPSVPGSVFLDFMSGITDEEDFSGMAKVTKQVLNACIDDAHQEAFWAFCDDPNNGVDIEMLAEISGYLSELFSGDRPPQPSPA